MLGESPLNVLCLHESGTTGAVWDPLSQALGSRASVLAPDRPGWGASEAPDGYAKTTVGEQASLGAAIIEKVSGSAVVCGSGIGAVAALELAIARPELVSGSVLIEPPLLSFVPEATEQLSADVASVRELVASGGREAALDAYLAGELPALGPGAGRIPDGLADRGERAAGTLLGELSAVPAWPRTAAEMAAATRPSLVVLAEGSHPYLAKAARELVAVLGRSELRETEPGLPHVDRAGEVAALVVELGGSGL